MKIRDRKIGIEAVVAAILYTVIGGSIQISGFNIKIVHLAIVYALLMWYYKFEYRISVAIASGFLVLAFAFVIAGDIYRADASFVTVILFLMIGITWQVFWEFNERSRLSERNRDGSVWRSLFARRDLVVALIVFLSLTAFLGLRINKIKSIFNIVPTQDKLSVYWKRNFHQEESYKNSSWRWMSNNGQLVIRNNDQKSAVAQISIGAASLTKNRHLKVYINSKLVKQSIVTIKPKIVTIERVLLRAGNNKMVFSITPKAVIADKVVHNGDKRKLSINIIKFEVLLKLGENLRFLPSKLIF